MTADAIHQVIQFGLTVGYGLLIWGVVVGAIVVAGFALIFYRFWRGWP